MFCHKLNSFYFLLKKKKKRQAPFISNSDSQKSTILLVSMFRKNVIFLSNITTESTEMLFYKSNHLFFLLFSSYSVVYKHTISFTFFLYSFPNRCALDDFFL